MNVLARTDFLGSGVLWSPRLKYASLEEVIMEGCPLVSPILSNSHKAKIHPDSAIVAVRPRGQNGISARGRSLVKCGVAILEKLFGKECLSFLTLTLPGDAFATVEAAESWPKVVKRFSLYLQRSLDLAGLPRHVIGVTEIQGKRFLRDGGMPLHMHLVFVGRVTGRSSWGVSANELRSLWARAVLGDGSKVNPRDWLASVDVQQVKKSVVGYLGKYLTKGSAEVERIKAANPELLPFLPSHWYTCTKDLRQAVAREEKYGPEHGAEVARLLDSKRWELYFSWRREVKILGAEGEVLAGCTCYALSAMGQNILGLGSVRVGTAQLLGYNGGRPPG